MSHPDGLQPAPDARPAVGRRPVVGAVPEVTPRSRGHAVVVGGAALRGELGVVARAGQRKPTSAVVGEVVADAGVIVWVVDADGSSGGRFAHTCHIRRRGIDTVGYSYVKMFDTPGYRNPSRDDSRQYYSPGHGLRGVRLEHRAGGTRRTLATDVETADTFLSRARGLMFRRSIPDDYGLLFRFDGADERDLHMLFVPFDIDAVWLVDGEVTETKRLRAWRGLGAAVADTVIELPAGAATDVEAGDTIRAVE